MRKSAFLVVPVVALLLLALADGARAQWTDLGGGLAGTGGVAPVLAGLGPQIPTAGTKISVNGGLSSSPFYVVVGLSAISANFKGGVLVPNPDVLMPLVFDGAGNFSLIFSWPTEIPFGTNLWWQAWYADVNGPKGFAASNALHSVAS